MKAFRVTCDGLDCIVFAESRSKAKYVVFRGAREVGYNITFKNMTKAVRAPEFDIMKLSDGCPARTGCSYIPSFLMVSS